MVMVQDLTAPPVEEVVADLTQECHGTRTLASRREPCAQGTFPNTDPSEARLAFEARPRTGRSFHSDSRSLLAGAPCLRAARRVAHQIESLGDVQVEDVTAPSRRGAHAQSLLLATSTRPRP